jgi:hypothetical protein
MSQSVVGDSTPHSQKETDESGSKQHVPSGAVSLLDFKPSPATPAAPSPRANLNKDTKPIPALDPIEPRGDFPELQQCTDFLALSQNRLNQNYAQISTRSTKNMDDLHAQQSDYIIQKMHRAEAQVTVIADRIKVAVAAIDLLEQYHQRHEKLQLQLNGLNNNLALTKERFHQLASEAFTIKLEPVARQNTDRLDELERQSCGIEAQLSTTYADIDAVKDLMTKNRKDATVVVVDGLPKDECVSEKLNKQRELFNGHIDSMNKQLDTIEFIVTALPSFQADQAELVRLREVEPVLQRTVEDQASTIKALEKESADQAFTIKKLEEEQAQTTLVQVPMLQRTVEDQASTIKALEEALAELRKPKSTDELARELKGGLLRNSYVHDGVDSWKRRIKK